MLDLGAALRSRFRSKVRLPAGLAQPVSLSDAIRRYSDAMPESERKLIQRIRLRAGAGASGRGGASIVAGIGDDAAVLRLAPNHDLLVTTDFSIENVHFRREWHPPEVVGWRCLTRGLSDIAAMGGEPIAAFLSLAVAGDVPQEWVDGFLKGLLGLARKFQVPLAGGDTAEAMDGIQADIVVAGSVPRGTAVLRSGAMPGDQIYVTGDLGGSAAALARLRVSSLPPGAESARHFRPQARVRAGQWLRQHKIPSAMIDISDGLSTDLEHICQESGVGAEIEAEAIPRARGGGKVDSVDLDFALHGGDDYELLFTSSRPVPSKIDGVRVTRIGRMTRKKGMRLIDPDEKKRVLEPKGWEHFRKES
jgi:thiamine-monophosphate kinase